MSKQHKKCALKDLKLVQPSKTRLFGNKCGKITLPLIVIDLTSAQSNTFPYVSSVERRTLSYSGKGHIFALIWVRKEVLFNTGWGKVTFLSLILFLININIIQKNSNYTGWFIGWLTWDFIIKNTLLVITEKTNLEKWNECGNLTLNKKTKTKSKFLRWQIYFRHP